MPKFPRAGANFILEDLKSRNGTFVNGRLINESTKLLEGDTIRICDIELNYHEEVESSALTANPSSENSALGILIVDDG